MLSTYAKSLLVLGITILVAKQGVSKLPYEVLDSIMELSELDDFKDLKRVNVLDERGPTLPIFRLDLDQNYVAYYEIDTGKDYVVLSSSSKTKDYREVQSGPNPRPTDVLIQQAQKNGQKCEKFYRLSPEGLTICKNHNGTTVAASYNWTADIAKIDNWHLLDQMVKTSLNEFQRMWRKRAVERRTNLDWATTDIGQAQKKKKNTDEEALSPGSAVDVALGEGFKSANVYITNYGKCGFYSKSTSKWQQKLCEVLVDVCLNGSSKVDPLAVKKTPNNLLYLKLKIQENRKIVKMVLEGCELGFVLRIQQLSREVIIKHYAINLQSKRFRRSPPGGGKGKIYHADCEMPDYDQHKCCGGCLSGCSPVAWAQVFGYYDRIASVSIFSPRIYGDRNTKAPKHMTKDVEAFVEDIRREVKTFCTADGQGSTYWKDMKLILPWFQRRQGAKARVVSYLNKRAPCFRSKGKWWLDNGYPVVFGFRLNPQGGHSVVATKYRTKSRKYRHCETSGRRTRCTWKTVRDYEFFLHYGWGGKENKWLMLDPTDAHVAYVRK